MPSNSITLYYLLLQVRFEVIHSYIHVYRSTLNIVTACSRLVLRTSLCDYSVCAFGVGEGADRGLVEGLANAGGGQFDFVSTEDRSMETKVIMALQWVTMGGNRRVITPVLPNGIEMDRMITANTDDRTEVHYAILKGKVRKKEVIGKDPLCFIR